MVMVGDPVDAGPLQEKVDALLKRGKVGGRSVIIENPYTGPEGYYDEDGEWVGGMQSWEYGVAARAEAVANFQSLSFWKRARWTLCAYRHGVPSNATSGHTGWSGLSLYIKCYFEQKTAAPRHPISPCSRRATSGGASPWDYTP